MRVAATNLRESYPDALTVRGAAIRCSLMGFVCRLRRVSAPSVIARGSLFVLAHVASGVVVAFATGCTTDTFEGPCRSSSELIIYVSRDKADSEVTTSGDACTTPECVEAVDDGCLRWKAEMTTGDPNQTCRVVAKRRDGTSITRLVTGATACGKPQGRQVDI